MKFDMHCHTKAGSIDAKVPLEKYIKILKQKNFDGMLVTDHDSYRGYRKWVEGGGMQQAKALDFTVLCGIEYDTKDAGHFIVILPDGLTPHVLRLRGMPVERLIRLVHMLGGVLGPAHPYGVKSSSAMFFKKMKECPEIIKKVDFIEGFNTCETSRANDLAVELAQKYNKPCIGGSDAHEEKYVGMGFTEIQWKPHVHFYDKWGHKQSVDDRQHATLHKQTTYDDRQHAALHKHTTHDDRQHATFHKQTAYDDRQPATIHKQPAATDKPLSALHKQTTVIKEKRISCNNDLIHAIKSGGVLGCGGRVREQTAKAKHKEAFYSVLGFKVYNRGLGLLFTPVRKFRLSQL